MKRVIRHIAASVVLVCLAVGTVWSEDPWSSHEALAATIERYETMDRLTLFQLSTPDLLRAYIYRSANIIHQDSTTFGWLEQRDDVTVDVILEVLREIRIVSPVPPAGTNPREGVIWAVFPAAIAHLNWVAGMSGLLDPTSEPRAQELAMSITLRALEYELKGQHAGWNYEEYDFLLITAIGVLDRTGIRSAELDQGTSWADLIAEFLDDLGIVLEPSPGSLR